MFAEENKDTKLMNELFWSFGTTQLSVTDVEVFNEVSVRSTGMQASVRINTKTKKKKSNQRLQTIPRTCFVWCVL